MRWFRFCIIFFIFIKCNTCITPAALDKTYEKGVKAYSEERWSRCIDKFEESLHLYKLYKAVLINCRLKCNSQQYDSQIKENIEDLKIYELYFNKRDCVHKCQDNGFIAVNLNSSPDVYVLNQMYDKKPYEYLHICYFQMRMFHSAASAAFTYLLAHPDDDTMMKNVQYYIAQPEVDAEEMVDFEGSDYVLLYNLGRKSYTQDNWAETVASFEEVLKDYIASENNCRVECEQLNGLDRSTEFVTRVSNNMASLLSCRQLCQNKVKFLKYNSGVEFLADVLNYIQMSYFHLEKFEDAAEAVATYLELRPNDEDMLANVQFYKKLTDKDITAKRNDIIHYVMRDIYEKNLLHFFHQENKDQIDNNAL